MMGNSEFLSKDVVKKPAVRSVNDKLKKRGP